MSLIKYASGLVFENAKPHLKDAIVVIDANGSQDFRNQLSQYLKKRIKDDAGYHLVKKVKTARSDGNNLIQLADMVSGAVWRSFKQQDDSYRQLISAREPTPTSEPAQPAWLAWNCRQLVFLSTPPLYSVNTDSGGFPSHNQ